MTAGDLRLDDRVLILRADATSGSGTGHVMRMLALGQAWIDGGGRVEWLIADAPPPILERISRDGATISRVVGRPGGAQDAEALRAACVREPAGVGVVDGAAFDTGYLDALADVADRILVVDDAAERAHYPVAVVLNQNAHADRTDYPAEATCRFLLGTRYVLLRREFAPSPSPRTTPPVARHLLVTFGGSDPTGMTSRTIDALHGLPDPIRAGLELRVVIGPANVDAERIESAVADPRLLPRAQAVRVADDMPALMSWADLAITSGGSTVWELARAGCPALVVETVPVESRLAAGLARLGLFERLGRQDSLASQTLTDTIAAKAEDSRWRARMTDLGMRIIDGRGADRVVREIAAMTDRPGEPPR